MMGVPFLGNHSLGRLLTDYGFRGYHLRKDFPISGYLEFYYDIYFHAIKSIPIVLTQELRFFHPTSG
jgi:NADH-quinone oxidoreductase subunit C